MATLRPSIGESPMTELLSLRRKQRHRRQEASMQIQVSRKIEVLGSLLIGRKRSIEFRAPGNEPLE